MFKKKLAIFALALALSTGTAVSAFADTTNKVAIENLRSNELFTPMGNCSGSGKCRW